MLIGHFAFAFFLKNVEPTLSLGFLMFATHIVDVLYTIFAGMRWENSTFAPELQGKFSAVHMNIQYSHSLFGVLVGTFILFVLRSVFARVPNMKQFLVLGAAVLSHWALDVLVHRDSMRYWYSQKQGFGLGLWNYSIEFNFALEMAILYVAALLYVLQHKVRWFWFILLMIVLTGLDAMIFLGPQPASQPPAPPSTQNPMVQWCITLPLLCLLGHVSQQGKKVENKSN